MEGRGRTANPQSIWGKCQCWYREIYLPLSFADIFSLKIFFTVGSGLDICLSFGTCVFQDSHFAQADCAFKCLTSKFFLRWRTNLRKHIDFSMWQKISEGCEAWRGLMLPRFERWLNIWQKDDTGAKGIPSYHLVKVFLYLASLPTYERPVCM